MLKEAIGFAAGLLLLLYNAILVGVGVGAALVEEAAVVVAENPFFAFEEEGEVEKSGDDPAEEFEEKGFAY